MAVAAVAVANFLKPPIPHVAAAANALKLPMSYMAAANALTFPVPSAANGQKTPKAVAVANVQEIRKPVTAANVLKLPIPCVATGNCHQKIPGALGALNSLKVQTTAPFESLRRGTRITPKPSIWPSAIQCDWLAVTGEIFVTTSPSSK